LQFEYIYELDKIYLVGQGRDQDNVQMIFDEWVWIDFRMTHVNKFI
jgi:hypothetical protein